jgi:F-type H+-transporting ATPase subunit b
MLDPRTPEFWVAMSFLAFVGLIVYYGVPKLITGALDARADAIRKELDEARRLREEAQELLADYQRKSREAADEAKAIIDQARREAEALAAETRRGLKDQVERQTKMTQEKISRAEAQALSEVRSAAVDTALAAAEKILKGRVAGATGTSLIDDSIRDLKGKLN